MKLLRDGDRRYTHRNPANGWWWDDEEGKWVNPDEIDKKEKKDGHGKHEDR